MTIKLAVALAFVGMNFYIFNFLSRDVVIPDRATFAQYPDEVDDWACQERLSLEEDVIGVLGVTDYLICNFVDESDESWVNFYVGYHERQVRSDEGNETTIHPPEHCLPGSGWDIISTEIIPIDFGIPGEAKRVTIARGNDRQIVYFWYQSRGHTIARDYEKILRMFTDRATRGRTDGALVRVTVPVSRNGDEAEADVIFRRFAESAIPRLDPQIPH